MNKSTVDYLEPPSDDGQKGLSETQSLAIDRCDSARSLLRYAFEIYLKNFRPILLLLLIFELPLNLIERVAWAYVASQMPEMWMVISWGCNIASMIVAALLIPSIICGAMISMKEKRPVLVREFLSNGLKFWFRTFVWLGLVMLFYVIFAMLFLPFIFVGLGLYGSEMTEEHKGTIISFIYIPLSVVFLIWVFLLFPTVIIERGLHGNSLRRCFRWTRKRFGHVFLVTLGAWLPSAIMSILLMPLLHFVDRSFWPVIVAGGFIATIAFYWMCVVSLLCYLGIRARYPLNDPSRYMPQLFK